MPTATYKPAQSWTTTRRYEAAIRGVLDELHSINSQAERYGVDRGHLSNRVRAERDRRAARADRAREALTRDRANRPDHDSQFPTFREFWDLYFAGTICPDCHVPHDFPDFHGEMIDASLDPEVRRLVINLPPYHAKTTLMIWRTIYKLCENPGYRVIIVSKSQDFARTIVGLIKQYLTNDDLYLDTQRNLIEDYGPFHSAGSKNVWSSTELRIDGRSDAQKDPNVLGLGAQGQIYGRRAEDVIFDDYATLDNSSTPDAVAKLLGWTDKEALSRIGKLGKAIWVGTRLSGHDPYGHLCQRSGYHVIRKSCIIDENNETVLWPEHFPFDQAAVHREEMSVGDWQLVYQNVDTLGSLGSFPPEVLEKAKDTTRVLGHFEQEWLLVGGVDPAGGKKGSGYTALTVLGIDLGTGKMYLVDQHAQKSMPAYAMKDHMLAWSEEYPIRSWMCEDSGLQSQLFQYNRELVQELAKKGVRVQPHTTGRNKWDPQFGVESMAPMFDADLFSIPWGSPGTKRMLEPLIQELAGFPLSAVFDRVMSTWFAYLGCRERLHAGHMPLYNERATRRWPARVRRRRRVVNIAEGRVEPVPLRNQRPGRLHRTAEQAHRRAVVGYPGMDRPPPFETDPELVQLANVAQAYDPETGEVFET